MKPNILVFNKGYLPGHKYGGPIHSISNIVDALGDELSFKIVTNDRDSGDFESYKNIEIGRWQNVGKAKVFYLHPSQRSMWKIFTLMKNTSFEVLYLNSFFDPEYSIAPLLGQRLGLVPQRSTILAPRGEFSRGALSLRAGKKRAYIKSMQFLGIEKNILWHASNEREAEDIRRVIPSSESNISIASNFPRSMTGNFTHSARKHGDPLRIIFLSRVNRKKNLKFILDVLNLINVPIILNIFGHIADEDYWMECKTRIEALPENICVRYCGAIPADEVQKAMTENDLFFLPTLGENFGHAIIEALGAGTPALISNNTPWADLADYGCGWVLSLDELEPFAKIIEKEFYETTESTVSRRNSAKKYAQKFGASKHLEEDNRNLFSTALSMNVR